jgi:hypothetical protein
MIPNSSFKSPFQSLSPLFSTSYSFPKKKKLIKDKKISGGAGMLESVEVERGFRRDIQ